MTFDLDDWNGTTTSDGPAPEMNLDNLFAEIEALKSKPIPAPEPWVISLCDYEKLRKKLRLSPTDRPSSLGFTGTFGSLDLVVEDEYHGPPMPLSQLHRPECRCGRPGTFEEHSCPHDEELGDGTVRCHCCEDCESSCAEDI